jgi:hypothetical protein
MNGIVACKTSWRPEHVFYKGCQRGHRYCAATVTVMDYHKFISWAQHGSAYALELKSYGAMFCLVAVQHNSWDPLEFLSSKPVCWYVHSLRRMRFSVSFCWKKEGHLKPRPVRSGIILRFTGAPKQYYYNPQVGIHVIYLNIRNLQYVDMDFHHQI